MHSAHPVLGVFPDRKKITSLLGGLLVLVAPFSFSAAETLTQPITLHYIQRPPYMEASNDGLAGLTGGVAVQAFRKANIPFNLQETPFARQLQLVKVNAGRDCMIGIFKKPEREQFAKFTRPIYRDQTQVLLTAQDNAARFATHHTVEEIFNDKGLTLLVKLDYSYGVGVDTLIVKTRPTLRSTSDENLLMIKALKLKAADFMIIAPEEAAYAVVAAGFSESDFRQIKPANMPQSDYRHIMCSKNVPDGVIRKLNTAIGNTK